MNNPHAEGTITVSARWFGLSLIVFEISAVVLGALFVPDLLQISTNVTHKVSGWVEGIITLSIFSLFAFAAVCIAVHVILALMRQTDRSRRLKFVLAGYFSTIVIFAALYFILTASADCKRAYGQYYFCDTISLESLESNQIKLLDFPKDTEPALQGLDEHVLNGVLDGVPKMPGSLSFESWEAVSTVRLVKHRGISPVIGAAGNRIPVFLDCLHFSITTAATVGYGDIFPKSRIAKFIADIQILSSTAIIIIGLGFALSTPVPADQTGGQTAKRKGRE